MGKASRPRVLADTQAKAVGRNIRTSPRKLNLVAQSIRGKSAESALNELTFSPKRVAKVVKKVLQSAIANAENNHDLDVDDLVVSEASVGKNLIMKRFHARARGRGARIEKPFAQITVVVEEKQAKEKKSAPKKRRGRTQSQSKPAAQAAAVETAGAEGEA
ncbi:MAG: 50S ribosomal protein L22 [Alphaproteobacteria bacterium]|nr:50S ribosomal protein L22 [Alphaproteobacteria bacterium]